MSKCNIKSLRVDFFQEFKSQIDDFCYNFLLKFVIIKDFFFINHFLNLLFIKQNNSQLYIKKRLFSKK